MHFFLDKCPDTAHNIQESNFSQTHIKWTKWIEDESNGRIKITFYPSEQAAKGTECYDAAKGGIVDMACQLVAFNPGRWPLTEVVMLPFIFDYPGSRAASLTAVELFNKYLEIQAEHTEVKVLGFYTNAPSQIHTVNKPVHTMEDLKGQVLDVAGSWGAGALQILGGTPETTSPAERYDALAKGVLDGVASTEWEGHLAWNNVELCHYSTECSMNLFAFVHVMNLDTWNRLPKDLQKLFEGDNARRFYELQGYVFDLGDMSAREEVDKIYKSRGDEGIYVLPDTEKARWVEAVAPLRAQWLEAAAAKVGQDKAQAIMDDCLKFAEQYKGYPDEACSNCADTLNEWGALGY